MWEDSMICMVQQIHRDNLYHKPKARAMILPINVSGLIYVFKSMGDFFSNQLRDK